MCASPSTCVVAVEGGGTLRPQSAEERESDKDAGFQKRFSM